MANPPQISHPSINQSRGNSPKSPISYQNGAYGAKTYRNIGDVAGSISNNIIFPNIFSVLSYGSSYGSIFAQESADFDGLIQAVITTNIDGNNSLNDGLLNGGVNTVNFWTITTNAYFNEMPPNKTTRGWNISPDPLSELLPKSAKRTLIYDLQEGCYVRIPAQLVFNSNIDALVEESCKKIFLYYLSVLGQQARLELYNELDYLYGNELVEGVGEPRITTLKKSINSQILGVIKNFGLSQSGVATLLKFLGSVMGAAPAYWIFLYEKALDYGLLSRRVNYEPNLSDNQSIEMLSALLTHIKLSQKDLSPKVNFASFSDTLLKNNIKHMDATRDILSRSRDIFASFNLIGANPLEFNTPIATYELYKISIINLRNKLLSFQAWTKTKEGKKALNLLIDKKCGPKFRIYNPLTFAKTGKKENIRQIGSVFNNNKFGTDSELPRILQKLIPNIDLGIYKNPDGSYDYEAMRDVQRQELVLRGEPVWAELDPLTCTCSECENGYTKEPDYFEQISPGPLLGGMTNNKPFDHYIRCLKCCENEVIVTDPTDRTTNGPIEDNIYPGPPSAVFTNPKTAASLKNSNCSCTESVIPNFAHMPCSSGCEKPENFLSENFIPSVVFDLFVKPKKRMDGLSDEQINNNYRKFVCADPLPPDFSKNNPARTEAVLKSRSRYISVLKESQYEWDADSCEWVCRNYVFKEVPWYWMGNNSLETLERQEYPVDYICRIRHPFSQCEEWTYVPDPNWVPEDAPKPRSCVCVCLDTTTTPPPPSGSGSSGSYGGSQQLEDVGFVFDPITQSWKIK